MTRITIYSFIFLSVLFVNTNAISKSNYFDQGEKLFKEEKFSESKFKFEKDIVYNTLFHINRKKIGVFYI